MNKTYQPNSLTQALLPPMLLSLLMWIIYKLDVLYSLDLFVYGLFPRKVEGLGGILFSPLIHDTQSFYHVFENTIALIFFGTMLFYFYRKIALRIVLFTWLGEGLLVWLMGRETYHVGMSGVIYGLAFFMITSSIIRKNRQLTGLNFLIIFLYGSIFWGLFPLMPKVSWESHLAGALVGVALGILYRHNRADHVEYRPPIEDDPLDDEPDAWWKTGIIQDKFNSEQIQVHYEYRPKEKDPDEKDK